MPGPAMGAAPAIAPPPQGGAVQSGGAGGAPDGVLPPSASPQPGQAAVPPQGQHQLFMHLMRVAMGIIHFARSQSDPSTKESEAADKMYDHGRKHFIPDSDSMKSGGMPSLAQPGQGQSMGGAPPPQPPRGPIPVQAPQGMM